MCWLTNFAKVCALAAATMQRKNLFWCLSDALIVFSAVSIDTEAKIHKTSINVSKNMEETSPFRRCVVIIWTLVLFCFKKGFSRKLWKALLYIKTLEKYRLYTLALALQASLWERSFWKLVLPNLSVSLKLLTKAFVTLLFTNQTFSLRVWVAVVFSNKNLCLHGLKENIFGAIWAIGFLLWCFIDFLSIRDISCHCQKSSCGT